LKLELQNIPRRSNLSKEDFLREYFEPRRPVIIEDLSQDWPARTKWNFDYFKEKTGEVIVPLYDGKPASGRSNSHGPARKIPFKDYIDILQDGPSDLRMFFFNLLKNCPDLINDFKYPELGIKFFKKLPVLFVGGEGSKVVMHYDMDLANNFHFNFAGRKRIILYPPDQTGFLYKVPYSIVSMEIIDMDDPDLQKYPALAKARGFECTLEHGDALYIPSHWWHWVKYETPSLSLTLRSLPTKPSDLGEVISNLLFMRNYDNLMRKLKGQKWIDYKNRKAIKRTHRYAGIN